MDRRRPYVNHAFRDPADEIGITEHAVPGQACFELHLQGDSEIHSRSGHLDRVDQVGKGNAVDDHGNRAIFSVQRRLAQKFDLPGLDPPRHVRPGTDGSLLIPGNLRIDA